MTGTNNARRLSGLTLGSLVALGFGTSFVMINSGDLPSPWPVVIRVTGALIALGLLVQVFRTERETAPTRVDDIQGFADRRYWYAVIGEVIALFGGLYVINKVLARPEVAIAWVAVVVGVHFFPLGWAWRMPLYYRIGAVMTLLGLAGFLAYALGAAPATIQLISGVGSGFALYGTVLMGLRIARSRSLATGREASGDPA